MKPQLSILALLGVSAFVGLSIAAYLRPLSIWPQVAFYAAATLMLGVLLVACGETTGRAVFCRGMFCTVVLLTTLRMWEPLTPSISRYQLLNWPFTYFTGLPEDSPATVENRRDLTMQSVQLAFGLLGGLTAHWRYQALERRAKTRHSSE